MGFSSMICPLTYFCLQQPSRKFFPRRTIKGKTSVKCVNVCVKLYIHQSSLISTEEIKRFVRKV